MNIHSAEHAFNSLCSDVQSCKICPRMRHSKRVLNRSVGRLDARLMFVGEAPGRLGADSSGIPFHGDKAGHNFEALLKSAGITRGDVYVTNAVLCNPKRQDGNNATPTTQEILNCSKHLTRQIELINPKIVVTLGARALEALNFLEPHNLTLKDARKAIKWFGRILIPLYHPGQRAMLHRSMEKQMVDYKFVGRRLDALPGSKCLTSSEKFSSRVTVIVDYILSRKNPISYYTLHNLFYLVEYYSVLHLGEKMTDAYFVRQQDGPYCTDLHIQKLKKTIKDLNVKRTKDGSFILERNVSSLFEGSGQFEMSDVADGMEVVDQVLSRYGNQDAKKLRESVFLTQPMQNILSVEASTNITLYNSPLEFHVATSH